MPKPLGHAARRLQRSASHGAPESEPDSACRCPTLRVMGSSLDPAATAVARQLAELAGKQRSGLVESSWWTERMLEWAMSHPSFKTQLFRFVDVFPATSGDADVLRHLEEYFEGADVPKALDLGLDLAEHVPFGRATAGHRSPGTTSPRWPGSSSWGRGRPRPWTACTACGGRGARSPSTCWARRPSPSPRPTSTPGGSSELLAALVEATPRWAPDDHLERDDLGPLPRVNVSVKPTALSSRYSPADARTTASTRPSAASAPSCARPRPAAPSSTSTPSTTTSRTSPSDWSASSCPSPSSPRWRPASSSRPT